jgi:hypothetical protein
MGFINLCNSLKLQNLVDHNINIKYEKAIVYCIIHNNRF